MSQQEVIQFVKENYDYDNDSRRVKIKNKEYILHITKTNFEFHEERKEEDVSYIKNIVIKEDINIEVTRAFNFKEITSKELLKDCIESIFKSIY